MTSYIGRFAPSPTGLLHFGSLLAAVASYCDAKANGGQWLVRIEDIDKPREVTDAAEGILQTLADFGLHWDQAVCYQNQRTDLYEAALAQLKQQGLAYPCQCSRKTIQANSTQTGIEGAIYPGTCLQHPITPSAHTAWRIKTQGSSIQVTDAVLQNEVQAIDKLFGDFVIKRADQLFSYQLAVVVDDADQGVTHVVRGADLWQSTSRQCYLQQCLGYQTPQYAHLPIITNTLGQKLSKQTLAKPIEASSASGLLFDALSLLNQNPPLRLRQAKSREILNWAVEHWQMKAVPKQAIVRSEA